MKRDEAKRLIQETFENPFDRARFARFASEIFNTLELTPTTRQAGNQLPDAYKDRVQSMERIGKYHDPEDMSIDVLVVKLIKPSSVWNARTMQRNFVSRYLNGSRGGQLKDAALVAFYAEGCDEWRFSFIRMEYAFDEEKKKITQDFTPARRSSYIVGPGEKSHTAQVQLLPILEEETVNPSLPQLEKAFSVEKVTERFFEEYKELFFWLKNSLDDLVATDEKIRKNFQEKGVDTANFGKKLLGQIVFLYYLQKKGWFGVQRGERWGSGSKNFLRELFEGKHGEYGNFFNDILEPLFYEALSLERPKDYYDKFHCRIPFLNGGLFDPICDYDWQDTDIALPNDVFSNTCKIEDGDIGNGILDNFDRYNFTVKEDEPLEKEVAVDPEMLGKVFENLLEVKDRKSKGTYYTPREIVHYMCQESLINYLDSAINTSVSAYQDIGDEQKNMFGNKTRAGQLKLEQEERANQILVPKVDIVTLVKFGETVVEHDSRVIREGVETDAYAFKLPHSVRQHAKLIDEKLETVRVCDPAVGSGAFPVGMMNEIVNIRKALTLHIGESDARSPYNFKRHAIQDCLYGVDIDPGAVEIAKLRLWLSLIVDEEERYTVQPLPNLDYKIRQGNSVLGIEKEKMGMTNMFYDQTMKELHETKQLYFNETGPGKKEKYRKRIDALISEITSGHTKFDFEVYFSEVFREKKGFDVVIANPPYVRQEDIKELKPLLKDNYRVYSGAADLLCYFYELGFRLLHQNGVLSFITSNKYLRANYGKPLRQYFKHNTAIATLIDFGDLPVFEATAYPSILIANKADGSRGSFLGCKIETDEELAVFQRVLGAKSISMPQSELPEDDVWNIESGELLNLKKKIEGTEKNSKQLIHWVDCNLYRGVITGLNNAFVIDSKKRDELIRASGNNKHVIKKFLEGEEIKRFSIGSNDQYLIFMPCGWTNENRGNEDPEKFFKNKYPAIHAHLLRIEDAIKQGKLKSKGKGLKKRDDQGDYWWELRPCAYYEKFEQPKILWGNLSQAPNFALDLDSYYINAPASIITSSDLYLLGILNSKVSQFMVARRASERSGGFLEYKPMYVEKISIRIPSTKQRADIEDKVRKVMEKKTKGEDTDIIEAQIDRLVYEIYGLTEEEVKLIEFATKHAAKD